MTAEGFKKQFLHLHKKLFAVAFALTGNVKDAEDILQDTYMKLWNRRMELGNINNTEAYCVTLVRNLSIDFLRASRSLDSIDNNIATIEHSPETETIQKDELRLVRVLIDKLPRNQQQVMRLYGIESFTMEEIEQITGFSAVNIRVLLTRARTFIKEQYNQLVCYERIRR